MANGRQGVQTQWAYFFRRFAKTHHIPLCLVSRKGLLTDSLRESGVPFEVVPWRIALPGWRPSAIVGRARNAIYFPRIVRIAQRFDPDIIEGGMSDYPLLRRLAQKTRALIVCRLRGNHVFTRDLGDYAFVDKFLPISHRLAAPLLRAGVPEERIEIINDGVDVRHFVPAETELSAASVLRVGIAGRIEPFKRILECLQVAHALKSGGTPVSFLFAGGTSWPAYLREVLAKRRELDLERDCHFISEIADMREFYRSIDVLLTLSGGSVMLEAMAMGKPVVAAAPPSPPEHTIVKHGKTGFLYGFEDLAGVAEGLRTLFVSPELARKFGRAGREKVVETFDIEPLIGRTLAVYQDLPLRS